MEKLNCEAARQIDLVDYLMKLGYSPTRITGQDHWYLSPLREEKTASFKVDRKLNLWYDHATGKGGNFIDFGVSYFKCSVSGLLDRLNQSIAFSFQSPQQPKELQEKAGEKKNSSDPKIQVTEVRMLAEKTLLDYLEVRKIPLAIAMENCREIDFLLYGQKHTVIGFENSSGGYELRGPNFKGSSSPKTITHINNGSDQLAVFEGFFDYLSFRAINNETYFKLPNFLILNSTAFFEKSRALMEQHKIVNLYLNRDVTGMKCTTDAMSWNREKYLDWSSLYIRDKDLNSWLVRKQTKLKPQKKFRRGL